MGLSSLSKAVRKFPPGGSNRWESISMFVNNVCSPDNPRSKEDCIKKYNSIARAPMNTNNNSDANEKTTTTLDETTATTTPNVMKSTTPTISGDEANSKPNTASASSKNNKKDTNGSTDNSKNSNLPP